MTLKKRVPQTRRQFMKAIEVAKTKGGDWENLSLTYLKTFPSIWTASPDDLDVPLKDLVGDK